MRQPIANEPPSLGDPLAGKTLLTFVQTATKAVPAVKYAIGVGGIIAVVALVKPLFDSPGSAAMAVLMMFILMWVLLLFAGAVKQAPVLFRLPIMVLTWATLVLFLACSFLSVSAVFFRWPMQFSELVHQFSAGSSIGTEKVVFNADPHKVVKIYIEALSRKPVVGQLLDTRVSLVDGEGVPLVNETDVAITVQATAPSGTTREQHAIFRARDQFVIVQLSVVEAGLLQLRASSEIKSWLPGTDKVMVLQQSLGAEKLFIGGPSLQLASLGGTFLEQHVREELSSLRRAPLAVPGVQEHDGPRLVLSTSAEWEGRVRADGISAARVSLFLTEPATSDVRVWLAISRGQLDSPFVTIQRGAVEGHARWTSTATGEATVSVAASSPKLKIVNEGRASIVFVDPIVAIVLTTPNEIPVFGHGVVSVGLVDRNALPVSVTGGSIPIYLRSNSPALRFASNQISIGSGRTVASTTLFPGGRMGTVTIEAAVPGYAPHHENVRVTGLLQLAFCWLFGGMAGIVAAGFRGQKRYVFRVLIALIGSAALVWGFVFWVLPQIPSTLLHSIVPVFVVAVLGSFITMSGVRTIARFLSGSARRAVDG